MSAEKDEEIFARVPEIHPSEIEMETLIGEGSYGQVYSGKCRGKTVAIKVFKESMIKSEEDRQSIRDEVSIMSKIYHPNVVLFMGACTLPGNNLMIVTEKMPTDLETLLIQKKQQFSLFKKIKMAIDAALGMNWLHSSNPMFIHRDLKLSNLLVDQNYKVCVCDFGLTQAKPRDVSNLEYDPHGSPLYMAPEVFLGDYNEKCDVYSFGIVLWEMLVQKEAFEEVNQNLQTFVEAVCYNDFRPPIPQGIPQSLIDLMKRCWAKDSASRPTMAEIVTQLHGIAVEAAISDNNGRKFWKSLFLEKDEVEWQEFKKGLCEYLSIPVPPADDIIFKCLEAVTATKPQNLSISKGKVVHIEKFGQICSWFGPLRTSADNCAMLNRIHSILGEKWFHGDITQDQSEDRLRDQLKGTFLIRFSSAPGYFTLSHLNKNKQVTHQRITYTDGHYVFWDEKYPTLLALLKDQRKKQNLVQPCPGSSYRKLFPSSKHGKPVPQQDAGAYIAVAPSKK